MKKNHKVINIIKCGLLTGVLLAGSAIGVEEVNHDHRESTCITSKVLDHIMSPDGVSYGVNHLMKQINDETENTIIDTCYTEEYIKTIYENPVDLVLALSEQKYTKNGRLIKYGYVDYEFAEAEIFGEEIVLEEGQEYHIYPTGEREIRFSDYDGTKKVLKID